MLKEIEGQTRAANRKVTKSIVKINNRLRVLCIARMLQTCPARPVTAPC